MPGNAAIDRRTLMSSQGPDALIKRYLDDVARAAGPLPGKERRKLLDDISSRIAAARLEPGFESEAAVREMLDRLGTPASVVAAATAAGSPARKRTDRRREDSVITWLLFGGLLVGVGWLVGVYRLWRSPVWSRGEKLLGTLVVPGGLLWASTLAPRQVAAPGGGVSLVWSLWGAVAVLLPLASAAFLVFRRRHFNVTPLAA